MPTILKFDGLRAVIYLNDHRPGQVHVMGQGCEARFDLRCPHGPLELRENHFFTHARLNRIAALLGGQVQRLCKDWRTLHGRH
ncbi:hypothetical protein CDN99_12870 [Roseateles aquatilis]|uniref:DUF4160 domain-containing protein n=1 Tax=Roseateles aquatilis TaxID=431061 RepID=A0A246JCF9_9BURK|nr:DUF4160 domain-containing protein [Roseateles aquatilis]OWQ90261.1 hypothetical protein CDN99_12870 [Roseateles aquatilis]